MSKTYEEWLKYYENATKEQIIEDVEHDNSEIERLNKSLEEQRHFYLKKITTKENIIKEVRENLQNSIRSINEKIKNNKEPFEVIDGKIQYLNDYQVIRLKAFRTKCKELLEILDKGDEEQ